MIAESQKYHFRKKFLQSTTRQVKNEITVATAMAATENLGNKEVEAFSS